jgi:hypothetical protein
MAALSRWPPSSWLTAGLGAVHVFYGMQRALGHEFETYRFLDVLALDSAYQTLFGGLETALGGILLLRWDVYGALALGGMLNLALFVASMGVAGAESKRAAMRAVAWLVLHFIAVMIELNATQRLLSSTNTSGAAVRGNGVTSRAAPSGPLRPKRFAAASSRVVRQPTHESPSD